MSGSYEEVPKVRTGRPVGWDPERDTTALRKAWVVSRHAAAVRHLVDLGHPIDAAWRIATAVVVHYAREDGWGRAEWNFSLGNIRWTQGWPRAHLLQGGDDAGPRPYRAYDSLAAGVADAVRLARTGPVRRGGDARGIYAASWDFLAGGGAGVDWYDKLMRAGWHPWSEAALAEYRSMERTIKGWVGERPPASGVAGLAALIALAALALVISG